MVSQRDHPPPLTRENMGSDSSSAKTPSISRPFLASGILWLPLLLMVMVLGTACSAARSAPAPPVRFELTPDRESYGPFEPVRLSIRVTNTSSETLALRFPTSQRFDIAIRDDRGAPLWRWSEGRRFSSTEGEHRLEVEGALHWEVTFEGPLAPGEYVVEGYGTGSLVSLMATTTIRVK
jgi:hypothetical protein